MTVVKRAPSLTTVVGAWIGVGNSVDMKIGVEVLDNGATVGAGLVALVDEGTGVNGVGLSTAVGGATEGLLVVFAAFIDGEAIGATVSLVFAMTGADVKAIVGGGTEGGSLVELDSFDESLFPSPRSKSTLRTTAALTTNTTTASKPSNTRVFRRCFVLGFGSSKASLRGRGVPC